MEHGENFPDLVSAFHRVTQRLVGADTIISTHLQADAMNL